MLKTEQEQIYRELVGTIGGLYEAGKEESRRSGNHAQTASYWQIGRRISELELNGSERAPYGEQLLQKLSEDLTKQYGRGFSERNLNYMVMFSRQYRKEELQTGLSWSQYTLLMSINETSLRRTMETKAVTDKLSFLQLKNIVKTEKGKPTVPIVSSRGLSNKRRGRRSVYRRTASGRGPW